MENTQKKILFNYFLYFFTFILLCFYGITHAMAVTWVNIGDQSNITVVLVSTSYGDSPYTVPKNSQYNFYNVTNIDIILSNYNFTANTTYQLEMDFTQQQLINANTYSVYGSNGESCNISYDREFTHFDGQYPRWSFSCPHSTNTITIDISNSSGGYLWPQQTTNIFTWVYSYLKYTDVSIGGGDNSDIINNNNQNTQNIINNQNQNTQDIIDSTKVCTNYYLTNDALDSSGFLDSSGNIVTRFGGNYTSNYYLVSSTETYHLNLDFSVNSPSYCLYDSNKLLISCTSYSNNTSFNITPSQDGYIRWSGNKSLGDTIFTGKYCKNGNQALNDSINNLDDTINDDDTTGAENEASEFFSSFNTETFGLTSIITAPLNLIRSVIGEGSVCTTLRLPLPYLDNKYLELPCMYSIYRDYFGDFFTIYQTITYGIVAYWVIVRIFNQVKDFKNPEHDEIEVMDL